MEIQTAARLSLQAITSSDGGCAIIVEENMPVKPGKEGVRQEMRKFKEGKLHSGSPTGPKVKSRKQAIAIALSEAGMSRKKKK